MKKYQWVPGTLVFSTQHNLVGTVLDNEEPAIENLSGDELLIEDIMACRYATEEEALALENALATETVDADEDK